MLKKLLWLSVLLAYPTMGALALSLCTYKLDQHIQPADDGKYFFLEGCGFTQEDIPYLVSFLQNQNPKVRNIMLGGSIDDNSMAVLANAIATFHLLDAGGGIYAQYDNLTDLSAHALAQIKELQTLDVSNNHITNVGAADLAHSFISNLSIPFNPIGDAGAIALGKSSSLWQLDIRYDNISDNGAIGLAKSTSIGNLDLENNNVGNDGAAAFAQNIRIKRLVLAENKVSSAGAIGLAKNTSLESLELYQFHADDPGIGDAGAVALAANTHITFLDINNNKIGDEGAIALAKNTTLQVLHLDDNHIGDAGAYAFAKVLHLDQLQIFGNKISVAGKSALEQAFKEERIVDLID